MITTELKTRIVSDLIRHRSLFDGSDNKFAVSIGINNAQYSRIKNGETERVLSDANWISLARRLGINLSGAPEWKTAKTPVFEIITGQLERCQRESISTLLCDLSDIGKTYTAIYYAKTHRNVVYVDCSQVKSKQRLIRYIAKSFGVDSTGRYADVYEDLSYYLKTLSTPLIILDEAGDLDYAAFLEIKALWNATEMCCGYYMMGADGLKEKIRRSIAGKKVGYTELFSRFGKRYGRAVPAGKEECERMLRVTALLIIKANAGENVDAKTIYTQTLGEGDMPSLRRICKTLSLSKVN
jgi:DNA transposition AAA+ family ATPase